MDDTVSVLAHIFPLDGEGLPGRPLLITEPVVAELDPAALQRLPAQPEAR